MPGRYQRMVISQQFYSNFTDGKPLEIYITYSPELAEFSPYLSSEFFKIVIDHTRIPDRERLCIISRRENMLFNRLIMPGKTSRKFCYEN